MLNIDECVLILLAAGKSERFGDIRSKLDQDFLGRPLGLHVVVALEDVPFQARLAIIDGLDLQLRAPRFHRSSTMPTATLAWQVRSSWAFSARSSWAPNRC